MTYAAVPMRISCTFASVETDKMVEKTSTMRKAMMEFKVCIGGIHMKIQTGKKRMLTESRTVINLAAIVIFELE